MKEHGSYTISVKDNLIISHFFGAWNIEETELYADHVKELAAPLSSQPWARIIDLTSWEGGGVEIISPLRILQHWAENNNCHHVVFISPPLLPKYMLEKYGDPYGDYKICENLDEAINWVKQKLNLFLVR
ncbi:hypothetical protein ACOYR1_00360 [Thalassotalea piscium]